MASTSIDPELDNGVNEIKNPEVKNVEEEQAAVLEQPKVYKVEKDQAYFPSKKHKNNKDGASITPTKKIFTQLTRKVIQGEMWLRKPTHILS